MPALIALPKWIHRQHPLVHHELRHWDRARPWRWVKRALWGSAGVFLLLPVSCAFIFGVTATYTSDTERVVTFGGLFAFGAFVLSALAEAFLGLVANIIGATLIARERETQNWLFLRLTLLEDSELIGGKLTALIYVLREPLLLVFVLRSLAVLGGLVTLGLVALLNPSALASLATAGQSLWESSPLEMFGVLVGIGLTVVTTLFGFTLSPFFNLFYNGLVSLATSTFLRSRSIAIIVTFVTHFALGIGLYAPVQQVFSLGLGVLMSTSPNLNSTFIFFVPALAQLIQYGLMLVVMVACYLLAVQRVAKLSE